jgi:hypothetical protein
VSVPKAEWRWFGNAGHFICAEWCRFHLCTQVGEYLVSTVGEYVPDEGVREIIAQSRGIVLKGRGDERRTDYMRKIGFEEIGCDRLYETMVFRAGKPCSSAACGCGLPAIDGSELDSLSYNTAKAATAGHVELCEKWATRPATQEREP